MSYGMTDRQTVQVDTTTNSFNTANNNNNNCFILKVHIRKRPLSDRPINVEASCYESPEKKTKPNNGEERVNSMKIDSTNEQKTSGRNHSMNGNVKKNETQNSSFPPSRTEQQEKEVEASFPSSSTNTLSKQEGLSDVHAFADISKEDDDMEMEIYIPHSFIERLKSPSPPPTQSQPSFLQYVMLFFMLFCSGILFYQFIYLPHLSPWTPKTQMDSVANEGNFTSLNNVSTNEAMCPPFHEQVNKASNDLMPLPPSPPKIVVTKCRVAFISQVASYVNEIFLHTKLFKYVPSFENEKIELSFTKLSSFEHLNKEKSDYFFFITTSSRPEASDAKGELENYVLPYIKERFNMSRSSAIFATTDTQLISKIENLPLKDYYVQWTSDVEKVGKQGEAPLKGLVNDVISKCREKVQPEKDLLSSTEKEQRRE
ncbi:hypothetical protein FDP41_000094 [Naegleria fowleri]|uniref:Uncharacterized protein n=1 Tax=Naegleria fowleri TaxID=5763 RepID=A0A6A5CIB4_NAEFO|nr:uncharacterized protein FDP41_000094 [Naegleria fowleri]KAF0985055.1 hypothetical protein FDP41_000094 [Naegleria fowleri]